MSHDADVSDSLSRTIAEFREEVLGWIDSALRRLREGEQEENVAKEEKPAPAAFTRVQVEPDPPPKSTEVGTASIARSPDSLKRLDALARLLDKRLNVADEPASASSRPTGEIGESYG